MIERWVLPAFAFAVSVAYWPSWHDGAISPKWCVLGALTVVLFFVKPRMTTGHWAGLIFLAYAALSLTWSVSPLDGVNNVLRTALLGAVFVIAAEVDDLCRTYAAAAAGLSLSGLIALLEVTGYMTLPEANHPAALFGNRNYMAEVGVICLVVAIGSRMWWAIPGSVLAIALPMSRAAVLALAIIATAWVWKRSKVIAVCLILAVIACLAAYSETMLPQSHSTDIRLTIWKTALEHLTFFGHGFGSFQSMYVLLFTYTEIPLGRPEHAHNEFINLIFELGVPGVIAAFVMVGAAWRGGSALERSVMGAIAAISVFSFPLHLPVAGFLAALVAGRACARGRDLRCLDISRRSKLYARNGGIGPRYGALGV